MTTLPIHMLLIEDNASDAWLVQNALEHLGEKEFAITHVHSVEDALPHLSSSLFDIILLDLSLPGCCELEALKHLHHAAPTLPVVILTGHDDEALALTAMKHGAQDYLVKERADGHLMKRSMRYAIERKHFEDSLTVLANYDVLTGLANRNLFTSRLDMALARIRRSGGTLAVFFLDLDQFKQVNDLFGHDAGDKLLKEIAGRLTSSLRECDTISRFGGDEFAVLLEDMAQPRNCAVVAQKMIDMLQQPFTLAGQEVAIGVSIGIAVGSHTSEAEELMIHADAAMYRAKQIPKSNYQFFTEHMHQETTERLQLEYELTQAIRQQQGLCLYYQPQIDIASGKLAGAEALIRWEHPSRGMLAPADFLPLLPSIMAAELDQWVLETVCRDIQCWQAAGLKPLQVSIHIANRRWENMAAVDNLINILTQAGIQTQYLAVEMEESAMWNYAEDGFAVLSRIRETGVKMHLDNFGADISSLKLLTRCPLDVIKIDRQLTQNITQEERHGILVRALVDLGHQLGMKVVAEGVETTRQKEALTALACDQIQGLFISKPLPANDFFNWMGRRTSPTG